MIKLIQPTHEYKESYIKAFKERLNLQEPIHGYIGFLYRQYTSPINFLCYLNASFPQFIRQLNSVKLPQGEYVPRNFYWLIDDDEFIGSVTIRHYLTASLRRIGGHIGYHIRPSKRNCGYATKMLSLALVEAKKIGLDQILLTTSTSNIASQKVIIANNGQQLGQSENILYFSINI